ncbi:GntR family transcriptional regulator [Roseibium sp. RKSG952]|uniref:GntR family transcriptional regulator n=1 Tax=Roseibium sp. RKSG952 TaxID=2529384 RepID=UPI0018AD2503|nr:GntR family transcriptional regulator [Roseibium sp. RKSG952]
MEQIDIIDRNADRPLHAQITQILSDLIDNGSLPEGKLPSEAQLAKRFDVSRITVRQALANLEAEGRVQKRQGLGTFVTGKAIRQKLAGKARTINEVLLDQGIVPDIRQLSFEEVVPDKSVTQALGTGAGSVKRLRRLYSHEGEVLVLMELYLPLAMSGVGEFMSRAGHLGTTSYSVFENELNIKIRDARYVLYAAKLDKDTAGILDQPTGSTCLTMDRTSYADNGIPLELLRVYYLNENFRFEITLPRDAPDHGISIHGT